MPGQMNHLAGFLLFRFARAGKNIVWALTSLPSAAAQCAAQAQNHEHRDESEKYYVEILEPVRHIPLLLPERPVHQYRQ